jgi:MFS family permease
VRRAGGVRGPAPTRTAPPSPASCRARRRGRGRSAGHAAAAPHVERDDLAAGCLLNPQPVVIAQNAALPPGALIASRVAQGIGAALLLPGSLAAIADAYPGRAEQARALGRWAAVSALALPAGPLLGGLIVTDLGWRAVFWINPPVVAACLAGVLTQVRPSPPARLGRRFDLGGLALATLALASAVYAVIAAGDSAGSPVALASAVAAGGVAVGSGAGFLAVERRAAAPLLPLPVFASPAFRIANTAALIMNLTANGMLFLLTATCSRSRGAARWRPGCGCCRCSSPWPCCPRWQGGWSRSAGRARS